MGGKAFDCEGAAGEEVIEGGVGGDLWNTARPARPHRLAVRTSAFQADDTGSIPVGDATFLNKIR